MELEDHLVRAQNSDNNIRSQAVQFLQSLKQRDPVGILHAMTEVLASDQARLQARQLAGITIKNLLQNNTHQDLLVGLWDRTPEEAKTGIRTGALSSLICDHRGIRRQAAQAVAAMAGLDIPRGQWLQVLQILITNSSNVEPKFRQASIMTLGYICQALPPGIIHKSQADKILTAIVGCFQEGDFSITIEAIQALRNSLKFIQGNIQNDNQRSFLVNSLCVCCSHTEFQVRFEALQVLCDLVFYYYNFIQNELNSLGTVTFRAINEDIMKNAVLGIQFWTIIADHERIMLENNENPLGYINIAHQNLLAILLQKIKVYQQDQEDEWNLHKASGTAIGAITQVMGDVVVGKVEKFLAAEINSLDQKGQQSGALVFGMLMEGTSTNVVQGLIQQGHQVLLSLLSSPKESIRRTTAWTISKICQFHPNTVGNNNIFKSILPKLIDSLHDAPKIACHSCVSIINLIDFEGIQHTFSKQNVQLVLQRLLQTAYRPDSTQSDSNLQIAAFSAISSLLQKAPPNCVPLIQNKIPEFIVLLEKTINDPQTESLQGLICSTLQCCFARANAGTIQDQQVGQFMNAIVTIFDMKKTVVEQGIQAVGALAGNIESRFQMHLGEFLPYLIWSIQNLDSMSILKSGTMCVGDLARALGERFSNYMQSIIHQLLSNLGHQKVSSDIKVQTIESLADIASHTKGNFVAYLQQVMTYIQGAASLTLQVVNQEENIELFDYLQELREAILVFYVGLLQGLSEVGQADVILGTIPKVVEYSLIVIQDQFYPTKTIHCNTLGLLGDIANSYQHKIKNCISNPNVINYLNNFNGSVDNDLKSLASYSLSQITPILN